jgi:hypothetical protein
VKQRAKRHFRNKKKEYLEYKINKVASNSKKNNVETSLEDYS